MCTYFARSVYNNILSLGVIIHLTTPYLKKNEKEREKAMTSFFFFFFITAPFPGVVCVQYRRGDVLDVRARTFCGVANGDFDNITRATDARRGVTVLGSFFSPATARRRGVQPTGPSGFLNRPARVATDRLLLTTIRFERVRIVENPLAVESEHFTEQPDRKLFRGRPISANRKPRCPSTTVRMSEKKKCARPTISIFRSAR